MIKKFLGKIYILFFRILGWKFEDQKLYDGIYVLPTHTSLWDAPLGLAYRFRAGTNSITFLTELWYDRFPRIFKSLKFFRTPDLEKSGPSSYVSFFKGLKKEVRKQYVDPRALCITVCPEGQLGYCDHWKKSFLHLSRILKMPIFIIKIDYKNKKVSIVNPDQPIKTVDREDADVMSDIRNLTDKEWAKYPEQVGNIRLESE